MQRGFSNVALVSSTLDLPAIEDSEAYDSILQISHLLGLSAAYVCKRYLHNHWLTLHL